MKLLLTGATGKIGRAWQRALAGGPSQNDLVLLPPSAGCDLCTPEGIHQLTETVQSGDFDLVVHAAAWTDVDGAEQNAERARQINTMATAELAAACARSNAGLIFYSTDYVFDGTGPKGEQDVPAPLNEYGRTKLAAEEAIAQAGGAHLIVRINVPLAPPTDGESFYSFVTRSLAGDAPVRIVVDQWNNPLDTDRIARWSLEAWMRGEREILHLGGGTYATRFDIARTIAAHLGADPSRLVPVKTAELGRQAPRPARGGLLCVRQAELFGTAPDLKTILDSLPGQPR